MHRGNLWYRLHGEASMVDLDGGNFVLLLGVHAFKVYKIVGWHLGLFYGVHTMCLINCSREIFVG